MALIFVMASSECSYPKYDIVEIMEDNSFAGKEVYFPTYYIFKIVGTREDLKYLLDPETVPDNNRPGQRKEIAPRLYQFNFDKKLSLETLEEIKTSETILLIEISPSDIEEKF